MYKYVLDLSYWSCCLLIIAFYNKWCDLQKNHGFCGKLLIFMDQKLTFWVCNLQFTRQEDFPRWVFFTLLAIIAATLNSKIGGDLFSNPQSLMNG